MRKNLQKIMAFSSVLALLLTASLAQAASIWTDAGSDDLWSTAANWNTPPTSGSDVNINFGTSEYDAGTLGLGVMILNADAGSAADSELTINSGVLTAASFMQAGSKGTGTGTLNIGGDAEVTAEISLLISNSGGTNGVLNMTGGTLTINNGGQNNWYNTFGIGDAGTGVMNMSGGTVVANAGTKIPARSGNGTLNMSGGLFLPGTLSMLGSGLVNLSGGTMLLDYADVSGGLVDITDDGLLMTSQWTGGVGEGQVDDAIANERIVAYGGTGIVMKTPNSDGTVSYTARVPEPTTVTLLGLGGLLLSLRRRRRS